MKFSHKKTSKKKISLLILHNSFDIIPEVGRPVTTASWLTISGLLEESGGFNSACVIALKMQVIVIIIFKYFQLPEQIDSKFGTSGVIYRHLTVIIIKFHFFIFDEFTFGRSFGK